MVEEKEGHIVTEAPYLCDRCMTRHASAGFCAKCDEPLMDLRDEHVHELIREQDRKRFFRRSAKFLFLGVLLMAPVTFVLFALYVRVPFLPGHIALLFFGAVFVGGAIFVERLCIRMFPPKQVSRELGDEALKSGDNNLLHGAREAMTGFLD